MLKSLIAAVDNINKQKKIAEGRSNWVGSYILKLLDKFLIIENLNKSSGEVKSDKKGTAETIANASKKPLKTIEIKSRKNSFFLLKDKYLKVLEIIVFLKAISFIFNFIRNLYFKFLFNFNFF